MSNYNQRAFIQNEVILSWLDFKENFRVEKSARGQANGADRPSDQRVGREVSEFL